MKPLLISIVKISLILVAAIGAPFLVGLFKGGTGLGAIALGMSAPLMELLIAIGTILALVIWVAIPLIGELIEAQYGKK